jgi:hypothetical protein
VLDAGGALFFVVNNVQAASVVVARSTDAMRAMECGGT